VSSTPPFALALFDLDGVLIDSRTNMEAAWRAVNAECGYGVPFDRYFAHIGLPFRDILRALGLRTRLADAEAIYARASIANFDRIVVYPGIVAALATLRRAGLPLGVVTSKDAQRTALAIARIGARFDVVQAPAPGLRGKPAPDQLRAATAALGVSPRRAIYIGDMPVDELTARNVRMSYAHAAWGYGPPSPSADIRLGSPADLAASLLGAPSRAEIEA
jgi:beta-phosphoglucomutase-like phosphatase (HAD superfamily)